MKNNTEAAGAANAQIFAANAQIFFKPNLPATLEALLSSSLGIASALESILSVKLSQSDDKLSASGHDREIAVDILSQIEERVAAGNFPSAQDLMSFIQKYRPEPVVEPRSTPTVDLKISSRMKSVFPKSPGQRSYVTNLMTKDMVFGLGPAGSGKTFLAIGAAVQAIEKGEVDKIILTRPAVEAGEKLGFLPGDMKDKVDPYMQPLYDALTDFMPAKAMGKMIEEKIIEISPLAFMRGRTLKNAFIILDEAQNATKMQMKMFLTRMGEGSRMVIVGDPSQNDLPKGVESGLTDAANTLKDIKEIGFSKMEAGDIVRHPLVVSIVKAYEKA